MIPATRSTTGRTVHRCQRQMVSTRRARPVVSAKLKNMPAQRMHPAASPDVNRPRPERPIRPAHKAPAVDSAYSTSDLGMNKFNAGTKGQRATDSHAAGAETRLRTSRYKGTKTAI